MIRTDESLGVDRSLIGFAAQVFVDFVKQRESKQHHRAAEKNPGLLPGVCLVECFDMDPRVSRVPVVHAATLPRSSMAPGHVDGIRGAVVSSSSDPGALKSGNDSSAVAMGRSASARIHGTGQQSEWF